MWSNNRIIRYSLLFSLCWTCISTSIVLGEPPSFDEDFVSQLKVSEYQSISLECKTINAQQIRWLKNGTELNVHSRLLFIAESTRRDAGQYRCLASNTIATVLSPIVDVVVQYLDDFDHSSTIYLVPVSPGGGFVLNRPPLIASPNLAVEYTWYKDEAMVFTNSTHYVTSGGDLAVSQPSSTAFGKYKVVVSSLVGEAISRDYNVVSKSSEESHNSEFDLLITPTDRVLSKQKTVYAEFDCVTTQSASRVKTRWFLNGSPLSTSQLVKLSDSNRRLAVLPSKLAEGEHSLECKVTAESGRLFKHHTATITVVDVPHQQPLPAEMKRPLHSSMTLRCTSKTAEKGRAAWYFEGKEMESTNGVLTIDPVQSDDYGVYQCETANMAGASMQSIWLQEGPAEKNEMPPAMAVSRDESVSVHSVDRRGHSNSAPVVIIPSQSYTVVEGTASHLLKCTADADPTPSVLWKFEGALIDVLDSSKYEQTKTGLLLHNISSADGGRYSCVARNDLGTSAESVELVVEPAGSELSGSLISLGPTNQSMLIGTTLEIPCEIDQNYKTSAQRVWYLNGERIPATGNPGLRLSLNRKGSLRIGQVGPDSIGEYTCTVVAGEKEESQSMWLEIIEKPSMPTSVSADLVNGTLPAKIRVGWNEGFDGNSPIIRYMIQMRTLGPTELWSDWETVGESDPSEDCCSYLLDNLKPSVTAEFRVIASNKHGPGKPSLASASVTMPQQPPAAAPKNVAASARSSNSIIVQWQKPQDELFSGDIMGYVIRYRLSGYTLPWIEKNVTARDARNSVIEQLITWQEYEIQVAAYNERGLGVFSKSIEVTTAEGVPTQSPKHVEVTVINSTAVSVDFLAPDQQRIPGVNLGYKVQFFKGSPEKGHLFKQVIVDPTSNTLHVTVEGLEKFGHYNLTVLCFTSPGDGPRSSLQEVVTEQDIPSQVAALTVQEVMFDGAVITWEEPASPNGLITRYLLRYWADALPDAKTSVELEGRERNITISGLQSTTKYSLDIMASTVVGDGPREETKFESGRPPVLPERASSLSISDVQARSVQLQFVPGHDGYTAIRQWIVEARLDGSGVFHTVFNISAPKSRSLTVTGLRPFTNYQLRLIAENVKGRGAPSEPTRIFETKSTNPETPATPLFAEPLSATSVSLSWTPLLAAQWNGLPRGYLILYKEEGGEDWQEVRTSSLRASDFTLRDLRPFTTYEIDFFAENMFGRSASAGMAVTKTYESVPSGSPHNVRADVEGTRTALVQWEAVTDDVTNGHVLGYVVRLVPESELLRAEETKTVDVPDPDMFVAKVPDLRAYTTYHVFVSAYTIVGSGPENSVAAIINTEEDLPGIPSGVSFSMVSEDEVRLKWLPPENANGKIKGYVISYWQSSEGAGTAHRAPIPSSSLGGFSATELQPNTKYTFTISAETSVGVGPEAQVDVVTSSVRVPIRNPPAPVRDDRSKYSSSQISIRWDAPSLVDDDDAPVRFVKVDYQKTNDESWTSLEKSIPGDKAGVTINRLSANSAYRFRIRFSGDFMQSVWSAESDWMRTLPAAPLAPPTSLHASPYDSSSLLLEWNPPKKDGWNSDSVGYHVSYREYPSNDSMWNSEEVPMTIEPRDREQHVLHNLASFRHYIVRMTTFNTEGDSSFSPPVFVYVGYSIPKRNISNLLAEPKSSSSIAVRWDAWEEDKSDVISGFKVRFVPVTSVLSDSSHEQELMVVENNSCVITDLMKYTEYQISVSAYNRAGEGSPAQVRLRTLEDVPGSVANLRFTDILLDSVKVVWDKPLQPNGNVTKYTVNYRTFAMKVDFKTESQSSTDQLFFPAAGLREGAKYVFTVWAETSAGRGTEATGNVTIGPNSKGPPSPTRPIVVPGQSSVRLTWKDAPVDITGHLIQAKRVSKNTFPEMSPTATNMVSRHRRAAEGAQAHILGEWVTLKAIEGTTNKHEISYRELEPSSNYVFRVFARNVLGVGMASPASDELAVPASFPDEPFYTAWWFIALVAMSIFVVIVIVIAFLCVTGSDAKFKRSKRNSADSLQLADGNFVTFQMKGNQRNMHRSRNDLMIRPGTTQSWLSDRDPPAYGSVQEVDRQSVAGSGVVNMYGLATDVIPTPPNQQALQRLSALVGRDVRGTGSAFVINPIRRGSIDTSVHKDYAPRSEYGNRSEYGYAAHGDYATHSGHVDYEPDSFDEEEDSVDGREGADGQTADIAGHYGNTDHYRDTWRHVRATEGVPSVAPPGGVSLVADSPAASSESTWPTQQAPALANGFSSFV